MPPTPNKMTPHQTTQTIGKVGGKMGWQGDIKSDVGEP